MHTPSLLLFDRKSRDGYDRRMSQVIFDEGPRRVATADFSRERGIIGFLLRHRLATTLAQAQITLLVVALVLFILAGTLAIKSLQSDTIDTRRNFVPALPIR